MRVVVDTGVLVEVLEGSDLGESYLTIFTVNNVVRELVGELNLRSTEAFLRFSSVVQADRRG